MALPFLNAEDTRMRLHGTICEYKGRPVYVSVGDDGRDFDPDRPDIAPKKRDANDITCYYLSDRGMRREGAIKIKVTDPAFSYRALPLGYVFYDGAAYYVSRLPSRQNRAGLYSSQLETRPWADPARFITRPCFEDCILGKHKKFDKAMELIQAGEAVSVPIHRHVAIGKIDEYNIALMYRGRVIGLHIENTNRFRLTTVKDISFLERILYSLRLGIEI